MEDSYRMSPADYGNTDASIKRVESRGFDRIHIDISDGMFVRGISGGVDFVNYIRRSTRLPVELHFLSLNVERMLEIYDIVPGDTVFIHPETTKQAYKLLQTLKSKGCNAGIVVSKPEDIDLNCELLDLCQSVLIANAKNDRAFECDDLREMNSRVKKYASQLNTEIRTAEEDYLREEDREKAENAGVDSSVHGDGLPGETYGRLLPLLREIDRLLLSDRETITVALDGKSASGKTTTARCLEKNYDCNVFHMDDFFLRPEQRTEKRLEQPGENVDHERFLSEVLLPLSKREEVTYRKYDCAKQTLGASITVPRKRLNIIEGVYSLHSKLFDYYDLTAFLRVTESEQRERILKRNTPDMAERFFTIWIPLEEKYVSSIKPELKAYIIV